MSRCRAVHIPGLKLRMKQYPVCLHRVPHREFLHPPVFMHIVSLCRIKPESKLQLPVEKQNSNISLYVHTNIQYI